MEYSFRVRHRKHHGRQRERTVAVVMVNGQGHITLSPSLPPTTMLLNKGNILLLRDPTSFNNGDLYESASAAAKIQQNIRLSRFQSSRRSSPMPCSSHQSRRRTVLMVLSSPMHAHPKLETRRTVQGMTVRAVFTIPISCSHSYRQHFHSMSSRRLLP